MIRVLGSATAPTDEDPLGAGDPIEVARLVRRALAAAGRRAADVVGLALVTEAGPDAAGLARFARRALGPHGSEVARVGGAEPAEAHEIRCRAAEALAAGLLEGAGRRADREVAIAAAQGPGARATVVCMGAIPG